jgi:type III pantothenate kinase
VTPDVVVDIGNTRMKWGACSGGRVGEVVRLPLDDTTIWDAELAKLAPPRTEVRAWAVASVNPPALQRFLMWAHTRGRTAVFERYTDLPIRVNVDEPEKVGLDRLFGAVAAKARVPAGTPAITVDVGTAVTVNLIDAEGVFQGGAIFPGPRLMSLSLHEHTAKLPHVDPTEALNDVRPAKNTEYAIRMGIEAALVGGVHSLLSFFADEVETPPWLFVTGGGHNLLLGAYRSDVYAQLEVVPTLTLDGIRITAEALP